MNPKDNLVRKSLIKKELSNLSKEDLLALLQDAAKNWLAHDGLWFRAVEDKFGFKAALGLDKKAWETFTVIEAKRIKKKTRTQTRKWYSWTRSGAQVQTVCTYQYSGGSRTRKESMRVSDEHLPRPGSKATAGPHRFSM